MKTVFIADDSKKKLDSMTAVAKKLFPEADVLTYNSGAELIHYLNIVYCEELQDNPSQYLVLTDMQMPWDPLDSISLKAGFTVLQNMQRSMFMCPAIVVSGDPVSDALSRECYNCYAGSIFYHEGLDQSEEYKVLLDKFEEKMRHMFD